MLLGDAVAKANTCFAVETAVRLLVGLALAVGIDGDARVARAHGWDREIGLGAICIAGRALIGQTCPKEERTCAEQAGGGYDARAW